MTRAPHGPERNYGSPHVRKQTLTWHGMTLGRNEEVEEVQVVDPKGSVFVGNARTPSKRLARDFLRPDWCPSLYADAGLANKRLLALHAPGAACWYGSPRNTC